MRNVTVAAVQMYCNRSREKNIEKAEQFVREAAGKGAQIVLLPELFETWYFCQERNYASYELAYPLEENPAVQRLKKVAAECRVVLPVSFFEREENVTYNSVAVIDGDGRILGYIGKPISRMTIFIRRNFILRREIRACGYGIRCMQKLVWESAGTSGSRKQQGVWRCRERSFCFILRR